MRDDDGANVTTFELLFFLLFCCQWSAGSAILHARYPTFPRSHGLDQRHHRVMDDTQDT